jgi:integrase
MGYPTLFKSPGSYFVIISAASGFETMTDRLMRRGGFWHFTRRVPREYAELDPRVIVQESTGIRVADDPRAIRAAPVARRIDKELEAHWRRLASGTDARQAADDYQQARVAARRMNIAPPVDDATSRTIAELLERIAKLEALNRTEDRASVLAVYDAAPKPALTFKDCAEQYIEAHKAGWSNPKHAAQWSATLATYAYPVIGALPVSDISNSRGTDLVMKVLEPIWYGKTETASRLRGRIEQILDWARVRGYRNGENPARWRGHLDKLLPPKGKVAPVRHHTALPYSDVPDFMTELREQPGIAARALEFTILTAARTSEVLEATPDEIDLKSRMWTVPASRMKGRREHRVPLSRSALKIIENLPKGKYLFPGRKPSRPLSNMAMLTLLDRMGARDKAVTHGFRSTFRDWGAETGEYQNELLELAIAHAVGDKVEAAYRRGDMLAKRHRLMADWEAFCNGQRKSSRAQARA